MATYWENSCSFGLRYVSWYKCLIVSLGFSHLGFWSGNLFLIAPFPDLCLLVPFYPYTTTESTLHLYPGEANMGESLDWTDVPDTTPICTLTTILNYAFETEHAQ